MRASVVLSRIRAPRLLVGLAKAQNAALQIGLLAKLGQAMQAAAPPAAAQPQWTGLFSCGTNDSSGKIFSGYLLKYLLSGFGGKNASAHT